jgi:hypothetical protein
VPKHLTVNDYGSASDKVCEGDDSRLTDARTPKRAYADGTVPGGNTIANSASETDFASSYTISGGTLAVGNVIEVDLAGVYSTALVAPTFRGWVKLGSTKVLDTGVLNTFVGSISNRGWMAKALLYVTAIGVSGSVECQGVISFATAATAALVTHQTNTSPFTIDTTGGLAVVARIQWGTADAGNTITLRQMKVTIHKA